MSTPSFKGRVRYYTSTLPGSVGPPSPLRFGQKQAERPKTRSPARDWRSNLNRPCSEIRPRPAGRGEFFPAMAGSTEVPFSVGSSMQLRLFRSPVCFFILRAKPPLACAGGEGPCRGAPPAHPSSSLASSVLFPVFLFADARAAPSRVERATYVIRRRRDAAQASLLSRSYTETGTTAFRRRGRGGTAYCYSGLTRFPERR